MAARYTTQEQVETKLGRAMTAEELAFYNDQLAPAIEGYIDFHTGFNFVGLDGSNAELTYNLDGDGTSFFIFPKGSSLIEFGQLFADNSTQALNSDEHYYQPEANVVRARYGYWAIGRRNYYARLNAPAVPAALTMILTSAMADMLGAYTKSITVSTDTNSSGQAIQSEKIGDYQVTYANLSTQASVAKLISYSTPDLQEYLELAYPTKIKLGAA